MQKLKIENENTPIGHKKWKDIEKKDNNQSSGLGHATGCSEGSRRVFCELERSYPQLEKEGNLKHKASRISNGDWRPSKKARKLQGYAGTENKPIIENEGLVLVEKSENLEQQEEKVQDVTECSSMPNLKMSDNTKKTSSTMVLVTGQTLPNEDRRIEYKIGSRKYLSKHLIGHVRKYSCAFLNSEGTYLSYPFLTHQHH